MIINHIALYVTDLERSTQFYNLVMDLQQLPEPFKDGMHSWFAIGGNCQLHLISGATHITPLIIHTHLAFSTSDMNELIARLQQHQINYGDVKGNSNTVQIRPDGIQQVFFQDPDGYWLEVNNEPLPK